MACFLLPITLCAKVQSIIAIFLWKKGRGERGIHWCELRHLYEIKECGGMGFRCHDQFNIALLAK